MKSDMAETEKTTFLADSSGSDGSLSKDLSERAEMNFSAPIVALPMDDDISDFQKSPGELKIAEDPRKESQREEKEPLSPKYDLEMPEMIETHMDSDVDALMLCEHCQGPITKMKKYGKSGKQFCSKQCAMSQNKTEAVTIEDGAYSDVVSKEDKEMKSPSDIVSEMETVVVSSNTEVQVVEMSDETALGAVDWNDYQHGLFKVAAPLSCFGKLSRPVKGLKPGMKLESLDKNNPCNYCVATVIDVVGHRVRIRYDGFGNDDSQDFWCNFQAEELFPIGWCAENSYPLQPPNGISSTLEDWKIFLTKTLTGALAAPMDLFRENENRLQPKVHRFHLGMKVEVIHPKKPSIIALATITKSLGPYLYQVTTEPIPNLPSHTFYGQGDNAGIFSCGWAEKFGIDIPLPVYVGSSDSVKEQYLAMCKMKSAPPVAGTDVKRAKNTFKVGQKLEAVDQEDPSVIRVATVVFSYGRILLISFDGMDKVQYIPCDSEDIFPIGWSMKTRHPLSTPYGIVYPSKMDQLFEPEFALDDSGNRSVTLPSFQTVLGKANTGIKEELNKKIKAKAENGSTPHSGETSSQNAREGVEKKAEDPEKPPDEGHCVYFNKTCVIGPYMDPDKVANMPDCTANGRPPAAVRFALELIIESSIDAVETMDAIQAGFCPKMFSKGKGKVLKKGLFRFDTKLRASRFLKRLCKKLRSCEYFLSFDPPKNPCPLDCKTSGTTSLESFVAMNGMKPKDDSHLGLVESQKIKRGRPRKDDYEMKLENAGVKGEYRTGNDGMMQNLTSSSGAQVRVLNPTSYNGRPLVPIAPGAKELVTIMPVSSNVHHGRPPPPYEMGGPTTFVRPVHANTVITSATQSRMVAPVNLRMLSPSTPTSVVAADISSPTVGTQNLATLVMVSKAHGTNQPGQGLFSIRGNVSSQGLRMPLSQGSRKFLGITGTRSKYPGTIKMHGPMYDQAPGTMNPMSHGSENRPNQGGSSVDSVIKPFLKMTQVHIPGQSNSSPSRDSSMANDFPMYRDAMNVEKLTYDQASRYIKMKQPGEIKLEPQDQHHHFQGGAASSPNQRLSPTIHIHLPSSSNFHRVSPSEPQSSSSGHLRDRIPMHVGDHDLESASRSNSSLTSPIKNNMPVKYDGPSHHDIKRHRIQHISSGIKNHLQVATANPGGSQSSLSPLHSPPPLRPRPSGQQRSIALRSPPNLTPSTVISHFDFTPVTTTTSVMSQGLHVVHHQPVTPNTSNNFNDGGNMSNGQKFSQDAARQLGNVLSSSQGGLPGNATVTLTYIPVKSQATDKIVYVPVNQNTISDRHHPQQQQKVLLYSKQRKHFPGHIMDNGQQIITQRPMDLNVPMSPLEDNGHQPFSGITRKFTVRTLHRDSNSGTLPAGLTTVRIQGSNLKEVSSAGSNEIQGGAFYAPKGQNSENIPQNTTNNVLSARSINMRKPGEFAQGNENLGNQFRPNTEDQNNQGSPFHPENFDYEELSDDDEDCDLDYEELSGDEHVENENNQPSEEKVKRRGAYGFRGKRRKRFLTSRKGGIGSHQYKLKYKQALEQAKFMRERRPSFGAQQLQTKTEDCSAPRDDTQHVNRDILENTKSDELQYADSVRPKDDIESSDDKIYHNTSSNNERNLDIGKTDLKTVGGETSNAISSGSQMQVEEKTIKRKRKGNSTLEGDFVFGQWALDGTLKKKRKLSNPSANPTRYLNDPLEKVKLPGDPEVWSEEDVASFINATECSKYADTLKQQEIDGSALLLLTRESLMEFTGMKLGPALKICGYVATLKGRLRMQQNMALIQS